MEVSYWGKNTLFLPFCSQILIQILRYRYSDTEVILYSADALTSPINIQRSGAVPVPNSNSNSKHLVELCVYTNTSEHHKLCLQ